MTAIQRLVGVILTDSSKRILIIDDDLHALFVWRAALAHIPHQCIVDTAQDGREALEKLACLGAKGYDLIITDLLMPHMNVQEFTATVRTLCGNIPVVWITAQRSSETDAKAREQGVYCCLDKPISLALMRQVVWEALETVKA